MSIQERLPTDDELRCHWRESPRWRGIERGYSPSDVVRLRGTIALVLQQHFGAPHII